MSGEVRIRSNVVFDGEAWELVPGEIVERYRRDHFAHPNARRGRQHDEKMYYAPCSRCHRTIDIINLEGCDCPEAPSEAFVLENQRKRDEIMRGVMEERRRLRGSGSGS